MRGADTSDDSSSGAAGRRSLDPGGEVQWFRWIAREDRLVWTQSPPQLFGHPTERFRTLADWHAIVHADDLPALQVSLGTDHPRANAFVDSYRVCCADGRYVRVHGHGSVFRRADGSIDMLIGWIRAEPQVRTFPPLDAVAQATILENLSESVTVADDGGQILFANKAAYEMFGYEPGELLGMHVEALNYDPPHRKAEILVEMRRETRRSRRWVGELNSLRKDGSRFVSRAAVAPFDADDGRRWVSVRRDITERKTLEAAVLDIAQREQQRIAAELHDGLAQELTGLSFMLSALQSDLAGAQSPFVERLPAAVELAKRAVALCRTMAEELSGNTLRDAGLDVALETLRSRKQRLYPALRIELLVDPRAVAGLSHFAVHHLYRKPMVQA